MLLFVTGGGLFLRRSLAQDNGALNFKAVLKSVVSVCCKIGRSVLDGFVVGRSSLLVSPLLLRLLLLRPSSSLSSVACAQAQARASCCLFLLSLSRRLDDATLLPSPPSPNDPFVGNC